jgi:hypothetical protein
MKNKNPHEINKLSGGRTHVTLNGNKMKEAKHPKSGPRSYQVGDNEKFANGYDRIFNKKPVCKLCQGKAEKGTCAICS